MANQEDATVFAPVVEWHDFQHLDDESCLLYSHLSYSGGYFHVFAIRVVDTGGGMQRACKQAHQDFIDRVVTAFDKVGDQCRQFTVKIEGHDYLLFLYPGTF